MSRRSTLEQAVHTRGLYRFKRRFEVSFIHGYILCVGPRFFLMAVVDDRVAFDGFAAFRISDVSQVRADPYASFVEAVLRKRGQRLTRLPRVSVATLEALIRTAATRFPLITIHQEQIDPDVCHIGQVTSVSGRVVSLLEIGPDATWDNSSTDYLLRDITQVEFGGAYEDALHLIGGSPSRA